jgi:hypothetical protein
MATTAATTWMATMQALAEEASEVGVSLVDTVASHGGAVAVVGVVAVDEAVVAAGGPAAGDADWEAGHGAIEEEALVEGDEVLQLI